MSSARVFVRRPRAFSQTHDRAGQDRGTSYSVYLIRHLTHLWARQTSKFRQLRVVVNGLSLHSSASPTALDCAHSDASTVLRECERPRTICTTGPKLGLFPFDAPSPAPPTPSHAGRIKSRPVPTPRGPGPLYPAQLVTPTDLGGHQRLFFHHDGRRRHDEHERTPSRGARKACPLAPLSEQETDTGSAKLTSQMETLLSLRRRSMNQPLPNDPDLPPTSPPTSSPPTASSPNPPSSSSASDSPHIVVAAADADPANNDTVGNNPSSSSRRRPHLTLQLAPPSTTTIDTPGGGPPISPTAPSPAETGTLVRRRSTANPKLPSQHPLPVPPLPSPSSLSPTGLQLSPFFGGGPPQAAEASSSSGSTSSPPTSPTTSYLDIPLSSVGLTSSSSSTADNGGGGELFWLPASLHPELAPQEFKAFIREHTTPEALARRSSLSSSSSGSDGQAGGGGGGRTTTTTTTTNRRISRRASLLRGEYKPRQGDGVGGDDRDGGANDLKRTTSDGNRRGVGGGPAGGFRRGGVLNFEQLTIKDLQRLEELAGATRFPESVGGLERATERKEKLTFKFPCSESGSGRDDGRRGGGRRTTRSRAPSQFEPQPAPSGRSRSSRSRR